MVPLSVPKVSISGVGDLGYDAKSNRCDLRSSLVGTESPLELIGTKNMLGLVGTESPLKLVRTKSPLKLVMTDNSLELVGTESPLELIGTESLSELVKTESPLKLIKNESPLKLVRNESPLELIETEITSELVGTESLLKRKKEKEKEREKEKREREEEEGPAPSPFFLPTYLLPPLFLSSSPTVATAHRRYPLPRPPLSLSATSIPLLPAAAAGHHIPISLAVVAAPNVDATATSSHRLSLSFLGDTQPLLVALVAATQPLPSLLYSSCRPSLPSLFIPSSQPPTTISLSSSTTAATTPSLATAPPAHSHLFPPLPCCHPPNRCPFLLPPPLATTATPPCSIPRCHSNRCPLFPATISLYPPTLPSSRASLLLSSVSDAAVAPNPEAPAASSHRPSLFSPRPPAAAFSSPWSSLSSPWPPVVASSSPLASPHFLPSATTAATFILLLPPSQVLAITSIFLSSHCLSTPTISL
ncbi:hypothetical protein GW17_00040867 [Ensete ventricosum]|nr:hypothetical protein GW17_00040867 [Ensete ventricosum]